MHSSRKKTIHSPTYIHNYLSLQETSSTDDSSSDDEAAANVLAVQSSDLPDSFVMTSLDIELRQCDLSLIEYHHTAGVTKPTSKLLLMTSFSGKLQMQLRRSSWGASLALQHFNVSEYLSATHKTTDCYRELISFDWQSRGHEAPTDVLKCRIDTHPPEKVETPGSNTEETIQRLTFDIECGAMKILANWRCIRGLINSFAMLTSPASSTLTLPDSSADCPLPDGSDARMVVPRRVVDWTVKMASPVIVLPQNYSDANSAALVLELGDVQFRRAAEVPTALALNDIAPTGES